MTRASYFQPGAPPVDWEGPGSVVLVNPEWVRRHAPDLREVERRLPALDRHVWVSTSGTSSVAPGLVRFVALSKEAFLASGRAVNAHLGAVPVDVWAHALPTFHVGGLGVLARAWLSGAAVIPGIGERWDAAAFHAAAGKTGATLSALVPSQIHDLVAAGLMSPPSMRAIVVGGARLEPALYRAARVLGWPCLPSYGLTETCSQVATASLASLDRPEVPTVLPVLPHAEMRADPSGVLSVRAASLFTCVADWDGTAMRVTDPKRDGWFETEDLGRVAAGDLEVFGRASETVKVLGELVSLPHVEAHATRWAGAESLLHDGPIDLAVVARPHARLGHELVLVLAGPARARLEPVTAARLEPSLARFCAATLLPFERIGRILWADRIPRTALGKCQRALLSRHAGLETGPDL
jgi:O-succinylbenzoic acid--CoA ligase